MRISSFKMELFWAKTHLFLTEKKLRFSTIFHSQTLYYTYVTDKKNEMKTCLSYTLKTNWPLKKGRVPQTYMLLVRSPVKVKFKAKPKDKFVNEGKDVTLTCEVIGVPKPQLVWKKEGELVTNASKFTITTDNSGETAVSSQLRIKQISREDIALYSCISWNRGGVSSAQARVITAGELIKQ